jgi:hypothetical protein
MQNTESFEYLLLVNNKFSLIYREIRKIIYKITSDKISEQINYTNRIIRRLINNASEQIYLLFERYFRENIQLTQFKSATTIVLRKFGKKNYFNTKIYRLIALLNILNKILKSIVSKHLHYIIEIYNIISNI